MNSLFSMATEEDLISIEDAVKSIKDQVENAIRYGWEKKDGSIITNGCDAKNALIRTQIPINFLHDAVKSSFINSGVNPEYINPRLKQHKGEVTIYGQLKTKDQDICIFPNNVSVHNEQLLSPGLLFGEVDPLGYRLTESTLSINVRSQLSSAAKNFDTLYERTFAEPLNIHLRCPKMVLGDVYMIAVNEYDDEKAKNNIVDFKVKSNVKDYIKKYINAFEALNGRNNTQGDFWKYERVCLLIVDFKYDNPVIYNSDQELINAGLMDENSGYSINSLNYTQFTTDLLDIYSQRFGTGRFI